MAVRDYSKGKIYKIVVDTEEIYLPYVGSTIQGLAERMGGHRRNYKKWKNGGRKCSSFDLFDKFGIENCKIILLEEFSCENISQLLMQERKWFDKMECCNQNKPFISKEEITEYQKEYQKEYRDEHKKEFVEYFKIYYDTHKEQIAEQQKIYRDEHKEIIAKKDKIYYEQHKEQILEKVKIYQQKHKEQIAEKAKEKFECPCKSICRLSNKSQHERTKKHQNYLSSLKV